MGSLLLCTTFTHTGYWTKARLFKREFHGTHGTPSRSATGLPCRQLCLHPMKLLSCPIGLTGPHTPVVAFCSAPSKLVWAKVFSAPNWEVRASIILSWIFCFSSGSLSPMRALTMVSIVTMSLRIAYRTQKIDFVNIWLLGSLDTIPTNYNNTAAIML